MHIAYNIWVSTRNSEAIKAKFAEIDAKALVVRAAYLTTLSKGGKKDFPVVLGDDTSEGDDVAEAQSSLPKKKRPRRASAKASAAISADAVDLVGDDIDLPATRPVVTAPPVVAARPVVAAPPVTATPPPVMTAAPPVVADAPVMAAAPVAAPTAVVADVTPVPAVVDVDKITRQVSKDVTLQIQPKLTEVNDRMSRIEALLLSQRNADDGNSKKEISSTKSKRHHRRQEEEEEEESSDEEESDEISEDDAAATKSKRHKSHQRSKSKSQKRSKTDDDDALDTYSGLLLNSYREKTRIRSLNKECARLGAMNDMLTTQHDYGAKLKKFRRKK